MDTQTTPLPDADQALAEFEKFLEPDPSAPVVAPESEPEPEPTAEPEPESEKPRVAASTGAPDKRTREGRRASIQSEIDELTAKKHAAKAEADAEETRLQTLRAQRAQVEVPQRQTQPPPQQPPAQTPAAEYKRFMAMPDAPKVTDFPGENGWQEYQFAVSQFIADKRFDERMAQHQHAQTVQTNQVAFQTEMTEQVKLDPSFAQKLNATPVDTRIIPYLHSHPQGPKVMVYLVNHPQVAQRLTTLNPIDQVGQIGEIVAELKSASAAAKSGPASKPSISNAKPLIKPVSAAPTASDDDDEPDDDRVSVDEHIRRENHREGRSMPRRSRR